MLRITVSSSTEHEVALLLEGQIINSWVEVLRTFCEQELSRGRGLTLNLRSVLFADNAGAALLRDLKQRKVKIVNCSTFIAQLLNLESDLV